MRGAKLGGNSLRGTNRNFPPSRQLILFLRAQMNKQLTNQPSPTRVPRAAGLNCWRRSVTLLRVYDESLDVATSIPNVPHPSERPWGNREAL
jgi:hypothetical protein